MSRLEDWFRQRDENEQKMESVILSRVEISNDKLIADLKQENKQLKQQIEKMKCCQNCKHCAKIPDYDLDNEEDNNIEFCEVRCHEKSGWELKE